MCNQTGGLSRCLTRVQDSMSTHLRSLHVDKGKDKSSEAWKQENASKAAKVVVKPPPFHRNQPRVPSHVNDNYCVQCASGLKDCVCVPSQLDLNTSTVVAKDKIMTRKSETVLLHVNSFVINVHSVTGLPQKKGVNPSYCPNYTEIKYVKDVSCVGHLNSANNSPCRVKVTPVLGEVGSSGFESNR